MQIYESAGYSQRDAAKSILEHNIYGLDIDDRAYQLAYFAVMMKARQYNRRILNGENTCHVYAIQESNSINRAHLKYFGAGMDDIEKNAAKMQLEGLLDTLTDAKEYGSILNVESYNWDLLRRFVAAEDTAGQISMDSVGVEDTAEQLNRLIDIGETMARKYWVTCTNPPYAGTGNLSANVNNFVKKNYPDSKADLFAVFIERCRQMTVNNGFQAMITQHAWMFLSSFEKLREKMMLTETVNMAHLGARAFEEIGGEVVQTTAFVRCANHVEGYKGTYCRLIEPTSQQGKEDMFLARENHYVVNQDKLKKIPGKPIAYWISKKLLDLFEKDSISTQSKACVGMRTGDNERFLRVWFEVSQKTSKYNAVSAKEIVENKVKWVPYNKGGEYRKWYGNQEYVVNWENDGNEIKENTRKVYPELGDNLSWKISNEPLYFKEHLCWTDITTKGLSFRYFPNGCIFDASVNVVFPKNVSSTSLLTFLNCKLVNTLAQLLNPTLHFKLVNYNSLPAMIAKVDLTDCIGQECVDLSRKDWNSFETSWDFTTHPLVSMSKGLWDATSTAAAMDYYYGYLPEASCPLEICYLLWQGQCNERFNKLKANEEELNRIFIDIYGLQDELTPEVEDKDVTVRKADLQRDIKSLLSYAVGCMFGRYSTYKDGLLFAGEPYSLQAFVDMVTVHLDIKKDCFFAEFSNLGLTNVPITDDYPEKYDRLLCGGIWCIVQLEYESEGDSSFGITDIDGQPISSKQKKQKDISPISIHKLTPIQMPHIDIEEVREGRKAFTQEEWMDVMLRSCGYEPEQLNNREKWLLLARMLPLVENNFNLCELGPRSTGKSHIYKEISPNSILVSGGQTTVANLFYNMGRKTVGLVGLWDCVAFDEVAGIKFKDKDGIQIMKDYMASGSFARGKEEKAASASMVFVGNINQSVDVLLKTSSLFDPFPPEMGTDTAFLDRLHCYIPGWEIPKFRPEHFTNDYGFITDYLAEFIRELRKEQYGDALDKYFRLGKNLNQRDTIAVRKIVGGYVKLLYPDGEFTKEQIEEILVFALEMRRRVKEQLKKLGGMEFYDVNFSYIDLDTFEEKFVSVPEQGGGKLIPDGICNPGQVYTVSQGKSGMIGVFRLESQMLPGNGKFERTGLGSDRDCKESTNTAFNFLKANGNRISGSISTTMRDYIINYQDLQGIGMTGKLALPTLIALCSIALGRPTVSTLAVLGEISISGTILKVDELANSLQVCLDSGAKKVLLPITSAADLGTVPPELVGSFNLIFYSSAEDAVFKALGVE